MVQPCLVELTRNDPTNRPKAMFFMCYSFLFKNDPFQFVQCLPLRNIAVLPWLHDNRKETVRDLAVGCDIFCLVCQWLNAAASASQWVLSRRNTQPLRFHNHDGHINLNGNC